MKSTKHLFLGNHNPNQPTIRTTGREYVNPVDYQHPCVSMARYVELLALRYDANRTRHAYYRHLRLSQCLGLTIHDIRGQENQRLIRNSKGHQDRVVPLPTSLWQERRRYWAFHRHPLLIFPNVGRGDNQPQALAARMRQANRPRPPSSL